ncbi:hypothetical protein HanRHA438_Chr01g0012561 [Helianthus annuus]|nr:hypothetical protein HanRHA438_Chr01g0012561 [Helianthus annuus]
MICFFSVQLFEIVTSANELLPWFPNGTITLHTSNNAINYLQIVSMNIYEEQR